MFSFVLIYMSTSYHWYLTGAPKRTFLLHLQNSGELNFITTLILQLVPILNYKTSFIQNNVSLWLPFENQMCVEMRKANCSEKQKYRALFWYTYSFSNISEIPLLTVKVYQCLFYMLSELNFITTLLEANIFIEN